MTYRSDHDAALARVEALERENAELQRKLSPAVSRVPRRRRRRHGAPILAIGIGVAISAGVFGQSTRAPNERELLARCGQKLAPKPPLDDVDTDPHGWHLSVTPIIATTGCRAELAHRLEGVISSSERQSLEDWQAAEERLENEVSLIVTYYGGDPYALDHYASARQLWLEYERAYDLREIARRKYMELRGNHA